ncbi:MAG: ZIP family metal transporter [Elusimicrobia bacterium]|nr:ZIP family metal transporter [Elusimicrobiota bacterium]
MTLLVFTVLAVLMTFLGGLYPFDKALLSRLAMGRLFSVRAGILLAVAFTEILPEAWHRNAAVGGWAALAAFILLFAAGNFLMLDTCPEYLENCRIHYLGWTALLALWSHSFIDGFNLSVSFGASARAGIAVGLALALHKIADGFTLTSLFRQSGYSAKKCLSGLGFVAAATPLGSLSSFLGLSDPPPMVAAAFLGLAGGSFIYIAATDVLPRLHKDADRAGLLYLGGGMLGMAALKFL